MIPIIVSPIVTMYAQIRAMNKRLITQTVSTQLFGYLGTAFAMIMILSSILYYGWTVANTGGIFDAPTMIQWSGYALLVYMSPTIFAYGRIMGASWNTLLLSKWRTAKGWKTAIDPDSSTIHQANHITISCAFLIDHAHCSNQWYCHFNSRFD